MVPGGARDPLRAQGRRLGIPSGSPAGGGGPGARESAARGRDLSGQNPGVGSAAAPPLFLTARRPASTLAFGARPRSSL